MIEEYIPGVPEQPVSLTGPFAILLSAKNEERLKEKARQLLNVLQSGTYADHQLPAMAYTLQVGREAMEFRLAIETNTIAALKEKLMAFDQGEMAIEELYTGKVKVYKELLSFFALDEDMTGTVDSWIRKKKYGKILALWVNGFEMDWEKLYSGANLLNERPQRIALPTYPFLQNRYWPALSSPVPAPALMSGGDNTMHPLVHSNTSTFAEQKFTSVFTGHEFFLKDHVVNGEKLLPAVAYLEMVNEAMVRAGEASGDNIQLENIVFARPLIVNGHPEKVNIGLFPRDNEVQFEIAGELNGSEQGSRIHSQGMARYVKAGEAPLLDIHLLMQDTNRYTLGGEECYRLFSQMGIVYGEGQRAVTSIQVGEQQLLAKINLPQHVANTFERYILHPSIMDAALQSVIGFGAAEQKDNIQLAVPYAIGSVEIFDRCSKEMWAHITRGTEQQQLSFDIDICDLTGKVCVRMKGVTSRLVNAPQPSSPEEGLLFMQPYWKPAVVQSPNEPVQYAHRMVVVINNQSLASGISTQLAGISVIPVKAESASMQADFENGALQIFREVKQLLQAKPANKILIQVLAPFNESKPIWNAIGALFKTARWENPLFNGQVIGVEARETTEAVLHKLQENSRYPQDTVIQYNNGKRHVESLRAVTLAPVSPAPVWKDKGVYLITGGAGGLGLIFARAIASQVKEATLILTGRSPLNEARENELAAIRSLGARVDYRQADIADAQVTAVLIQDIMKVHSGLHGIIHSAGITRDGFILKKSEEAVREVLAPKVNGIINLDLQTSHLALDFFIVCSSSAGYTGNAAQADYAMANAFMDQYARYRHSMVQTNKRSGKTVSINWPLWKEGGIHAPAEQEQWLLDTIGMKAMGTTEGLQALFQILQQEEPQMMVMQGMIAKMKASFLENIADNDLRVSRPGKSDPPFKQAKSDPPNEYVERAAAIRLLKELLSGAIKLPVAEINEEKPMEEYGIDSVMVMQMTNKLEDEFGSLSKTLFFEYQTIDALATYFLQRFPEKFTNAPATTTTEPDKNIQPVDTGASTTAFRNTRFALKQQPVIEPKTKNDTLDIAVVGLAGRYPGARNLQAFWQVLKEGKNCITEIPANRWSAGTASDGGKWGGFLEGIDEFDPLFFGISAAEAAVLDPQERLFLQCAYEAIEDAGYTRGTLGLKKHGKGSGNVSVYAGVMWDEYQLYAAQETALGKPMALSGIPGSIANRVSYFCNFNGMSIALNTMCSSSLTAIHLACRDIQLGDCEAAIAGGVNLSLHPNKYRALDHGNFLSSKGLCESFGVGGDGYVPGEGVGVVLLKPLQKAIEDNDHIYGIIKGTAVNHGGKTNGYTVPNPNAQGSVIEKALAMAKFHPRTISYLEAHGTGTSLGDPIEITGLNKSFGINEIGFCSIGSVKSNIGHCESAAGIAGLTKVLLQMKYGQLAPSLHSTVLNPHIDFENSPFVVQQELSEWKRPVLDLNGITSEYPRRAGISSFGAGGSNAHILLEEYIPVGTQDNSNSLDSSSDREAVLVVLSARNETQLQQKAKSLLDWIKEQPQSTAGLLVNTAYTLQLGREPMKERWAVTVTSLEQLVTVLEKYTTGQAVTELHVGRVYEGAGKTEEAQAFNKQLKALTAAGDYNAIVNAWIKGIPVDWEQLYTSRQKGGPKRITLPTYPFAQERYWFGEVTGRGSVLPVAQPEPVIAAAKKITEMTANGTTINNGHDQPTTARPPDHWQVREKMIYKLKVLLAGVVQFNIELIDPKDPLENYGIESVMIVKLNNQLAELFGELPSTLLYEYQTLEALADYFIREHYNRSLAWTGLEIKVVADTPARVTNAVETPKVSTITKTTTVNNGYVQDREPIAIIGMSGRYPGANDLNEYWENLKAGKDAVTEIPEERWRLDDFFHANSEQAASLGKSYGKWGGFINGFADFDPLFFNMSPKEARGTDPQIRLFIESCWQVLEDAGYTRQQLAELYNGNVGVFAGITRAGFYFYAPQLMKEGSYYLNTMSAVANRASYILNLKGPSVPIDTMCSSSLTAIHEACESILTGRCEMAIAGGVNLLLHPAEYVILSANNFLSTDGRCRSFGAGGDGYVPGEGVGTVLLKRLSKAIEDKDPIYAVIKGTSINHGGKTNGYTVPNPVAQGELIRNALDRAGIDARHISYMEAHGTGTSLGDPIEITGLNQAFRADTNDVQYCSIGSSKSNIGHLEAAAGIAGVAKIVLQMKHQTLVPSLHAKELNPNIRFNKSPFFVQQSLTEWKQPLLEIDGRQQALPRIAGISSFGAGGANAHVIIEEYIPENTAREEKESKPATRMAGLALVVLSAKNEDRLKVYAGVLLHAIQQEQYADHQLPDIAYTLQIGREAMDERLAIETSSVQDLQEKLKVFINGAQAGEGIFKGNIKAHKETIALLQDDVDMATTIRTWMTGKKYSKLLALWVKGLSINWKELYVNETASLFPRRLGLPGYPFDRKQYWVGEPQHVIEKTAAAPSNASLISDKPVATTKAAVSLNGTASLPLMTFKEVWQQKEMGAPAKALPIKNIVWFVADANHRQTIEAAVGHWGKAINVIYIALASEGVEKNSKQYFINKKDASEEYASVFNEIAAGYGAIDAMVYWWAIEDAAFVEDYNTLVAILQAICKGSVKPGCFLLAAQWEKQGEQAGIQRCYLDSWLGFERTFKLVLPGVPVKALFKEVADDKIDITDWVDKLHTELNVREPGSVLYREGKRYVYKIEPTTIEQGTSRLKRNGTYLITGGLGKLGWLFAKHLAVHYAANLILTGRSPVDLEKLEAMQQLETYGGQAIYLQGDVADREAMSKGFYQAKEKFGMIDGVIHAAGVIGAEPFANKTQDGFQKVLAPKIAGTLLLDELLQEEPLDFICYFTSASAIIGDFGACDYSIANRFQMAFAHYRNELMQQGKRKGVTYAINWPLWREGGMDLDEEENTKMYLKSSGQRYLETAEGIALFEQLITQELAQHLVFAGEEKRIHRFLGLSATNSEKTVPPIQAVPVALTMAAPKKALTLADYIEAALIGLVSMAQQIPKEDIKAEENLADMGFDSISLSALALSINHQFDIEIAPSIFFSNPTIEKLKEYFLKEHRTILDTLYNTQQQEISTTA
ncbi:MAG TPA: SDR family NAD(P)-dependent oxidoreductase [Niastella sp.]